MMACWGHHTVALSYCCTVVLLIYYFHTTLIYILWCSCTTVRQYNSMTVQKYDSTMAPTSHNKQREYDCGLLGPSYCRTGILSYCRTVILSYCHNMLPRVTNELSSMIVRQCDSLTA